MELFLRSSEEEETDSDTIRVALIGRANVGKSTLVNHLLQEKRCVVSPIAGTTRDSIDIEVTHDDQRYTLIDTYKKYLTNQFRSFYLFTGAPLHFSLRGKQQQPKS